MVTATAMPGAFPLLGIKQCQTQGPQSNFRQVQNMQLHSLARTKLIFFFKKDEWMIVSTVVIRYQVQF